MGNAGAPNSVLDRAIERGSARQVHIAALACERVPIDQALGICLVYLLEGDPHWGRAAARLLQRILGETDCSIEVAVPLAGAIAGGRTSLPVLVAVLDDLGLDRAASRAEAVLRGDRPLA